jgi:hypothetical protein
MRQARRYGRMDGLGWQEKRRPRPVHQGQVMPVGQEFTCKFPQLWPTVTAMANLE